MEMNFQELKFEEVKIDEFLKLPFSYVSNELDEDMVCEIDNEIFVNAEATPCLHTFCSTCIRKWVEQKGTCPNCRSNVSLDQLKKNITVNKLVEKLDVKCCLNDKGCNWVGQRGKLENHLKEDCHFLPISCPFCKEQKLKKAIKSHIKECEKRPLTCSCGQNLRKEDYEKHKQEECAEEEIICEACKDNFKRKDLEKHTTLCPEIVVLCTFKCGYSGPRKELSQHLESSMPHHFTLAMQVFSSRIEQLEEQLAEKEKKISLLENQIKSQGIWNFVNPERIINIRPKREDFYGEGWKKIELTQVPKNAKNVLLNLQITSSRVSKGLSQAVFRINFRPSGPGLPALSVCENLPLSDINKTHSSTMILVVPLNFDSKAFDYEVSIAVDDNSSLAQVCNAHITISLVAWQ